MTRSALAFAVALPLALAAIPVVAADYGTATEAKAMLERAVAAVNADEPKALAEFSKGEGGFKDRDLYVFCSGPDGKIDAHPNPALIGGGHQESQGQSREAVWRGDAQGSATRQVQ